MNKVSKLVTAALIAATFSLVSAQDLGGRVLVVDRLPSGLVATYKQLEDSGDVKTLGWHDAAAAHAEIEESIRRYKDLPSPVAAGS